MSAGKDSAVRRLMLDAVVAMAEAELHIEAKQSESALAVLRRARQPLDVFVAMSMSNGRSA